MPSTWFHTEIKGTEWGHLMGFILPCSEISVCVYVQYRYEVMMHVWAPVCDLLWSTKDPQQDQTAETWPSVCTSSFPISTYSFFLRSICWCLLFNSVVLVLFFNHIILFFAIFRFRSLIMFTLTLCVVNYFNG